MGGGPENKMSSWATEALERSDPGAREEGRMHCWCPALALGISSITSKGHETLPKAVLGGGGTAGPLTPSLPSSPGCPATGPCLRTVPALHGGGVLWPRWAARSPLQQDPLLPGPVSTSSGTCFHFCPSPPVQLPCPDRQLGQRA